MTISPPAAVFALVFAPMILETMLSIRNERRLRERGAIEPSGDVMRAMQLAYPASFLGMILEGFLRGAPADAVFTAGLGIFIAAKALKYWAIAALGERWTFRVLVPPHSTLVTAGPYRALRHPNYAAVVGELLGAAVMMRAVLTGLPATLFFVLLIKRRIAVEERVLRNAR